MRHETIAASKLALVLAWDKDRMASISLRWARDAGPSEPQTPLGRSLAEFLPRYEAGERVRWPELPIDLTRLPRFQRAVLEELKRIPPGETQSYAGLAGLCGSPRAARAVGRVMATNPWPLIYPCHRVLRSDGSLGGFGPGLEMKKWLLELEGKRR